jgi:hypothetical protein
MTSCRTCIDQRHQRQSACYAATPCCTKICCHGQGKHRNFLTDRYACVHTCLATEKLSDDGFSLVNCFFRSNHGCRPFLYSITAILNSHTYYVHLHRTIKWGSSSSALICMCTSPVALHAYAVQWTMTTQMY